VRNLYQSFRAVDIDSASFEAEKQIKYCPNLLQEIAKHKGAIMIGLTAGVFDVWNRSIKNSQAVHYLYGNQIFSDQKYFVTPLFKKLFAKALIEKGFNVTAVGDSIIDIPMLELAHNGYVVAHEKTNKAISHYFGLNNQTNIKQFLGDKHLYPIKQAKRLQYYGYYLSGKHTKR
jgi:phosphoserine phosphatase